MTVRDDLPSDDGDADDDPFTGVVFDETFVLGARTREPSNAERQRAKIISLDAERARRRSNAESMTYWQWLFEDVHVPRFLHLPSPQFVAILGALALAALLLGGAPPFLR